MTKCVILREVLKRRYGVVFVCWGLKMGAHASRQCRSAMSGKLPCAGLSVSNNSESSCRVSIPPTPHKALLRTSESVRALH